MSYQDMNDVEKCPRSLSEKEEASLRLGCGNDKYGNNQYVCVPNEEKSSLKEYCHNDIMGLFPESKLNLIYFQSFVFTRS